MKAYVLGIAGADLAELRSAAEAASMTVTYERPAAGGAVRLEGTVDGTDSVAEFKSRLMGMGHLVDTAGGL